MSLIEEFETASQSVFQLSNATPEIQLNLYGLYKQAKDGDVTGARPGAFNLRGRAKYDAWTSRKGMSNEEAMTAYIEYVNTLDV